MNVDSVAPTVAKPQPQQRQSVNADAAQATAAPAPVKPEVAAPAKPAPIEVPAADAVKAAAEQIESYLKSVGRNLHIQVDKDTGRTIVTVLDAATGDIIRQIPGDETLRLARSLGDSTSALVNLTV